MRVLILQAYDGVDDVYYGTDDQLRDVVYKYCDEISDNHWDCKGDWLLRYTRNDSLHDLMTNINEFSMQMGLSFRFTLHEVLVL